MIPKRIVYFLGAGGSMWLGYPNTNEFLAYIDKVARSDERYPEFKKNELSWNLYHCIGQFYRDRNRSTDIEDIYTKVLTFFNDISDVQVTSDNQHLQFLIYYIFCKNGWSSPLFEDKLMHIHESYIGSLHNELNNSISILKDTIEDLVYEQYWEYDYPIDRLEPYNRLFSLVSKFKIKPCFVSIFTTNYDVSIEQYFKEYCHGSEGQISIEDGFIQDKDLWVFNKDKFRNSQKIRFYKIHGSVDRFMVKGLQEPIQIPGFEKPPYKTHRKRPITDRILIYPRQNKIEYQEEICGHFEIQEFNKRLDKADSVICVGSSFRDEEIRNGLISNSKSSQWIVLISPNASSKVDELIDDGVKSKIKGLDQKFPHQMNEDTLFEAISELDI